jgi:signal transduction histidine kinase
MQISKRPSSKHRVRKKVLIPLSLTFAVLIVAFVWACYGIRRADERLLLEQNFRSTQKVLQGLLKEEVAILTSTAEFIAGNQALQKAIVLQDVQSLKFYSTPLLDRLSNQLNITHFYYYNPQGNLLLRVYFPEDVSQPGVRRKNLQQAMTSGQAIAGLEIGRHGTFAQRVVFPWYQNGTLIGYIELGTELKKILEKLKQITQVELAVAIDKNHVRPQNWAEYAKRQPDALPWDFLADKLLSDTTINIPQKFARQVFSTSAYGPLNQELRIGQLTFQGALLPIADAQNLRVADLLMLVDMTGHEAAFYGFLFWVLGFCLLLSSALFGFAFKILGRVGRQLARSEDLLWQESASLAAANRQLLTEIAAREKTELQLVNFNQTLEERVSQRTGELERQNLQLEENRRALNNAYGELKEKQAALLHQDKMSCIGQLAAGIAHDINNPVGFISHNLTLFERYFQRLQQFFSLQQELIKSLASDEIQTGWKKAWRDFKVDEVFAEIPVMLDECQDGTTRITQIVQGLRTFIHNEQPKYQLTDLHHCLDSTLSILRYEFKGKIKVSQDYGRIPQIDCYPQQMNQLFMNLLLNACQSITAPGEIGIRTWVENEQIHIVISDTGCGIPPEILEKIYEPFFTTKPIGVGTGLGLSIVYEIIMRHQGTIRVESKIGRGSRFSLTFPCASRKDPDTTSLETPVSVQGDAHV